MEGPPRAHEPTRADRLACEDVATSQARVELDWLVEGYRRALARLPGTAWSVAIADHPKGWKRVGKDEHVRGLRFARNRVHHKWGKAIERRDDTFPTAQLGSRRSGHGGQPLVRVDWFWLPRRRLPRQLDPKYRKSEKQIARLYKEHLACRPVREALAHLDELLSYPRAIWRPLSPDTLRAGACRTAR